MYVGVCGSVEQPAKAHRGGWGVDHLPPPRRQLPLHLRAQAADGRRLQQGAALLLQGDVVV